MRRAQNCVINGRTGHAVGGRANTDVLPVHCNDRFQSVALVCPSRHTNLEEPDPHVSPIQTTKIRRSLQLNRTLTQLCNNSLVAILVNNNNIK